jgi:hypothetical protein
MKITVELSDSELDAVRTATGEIKKGPAVRKLVLDALMLHRRAEITERFVSGEWGVELATFEEGQAIERRKSEELERAWRD